MPKFRPGTPKPPNSGRKKGSGNRLNREAMARLEELGCDPLAGMAMIAADPSASKELRGKMYAELAQYIYPKRKAIECSGPGGGPIETTDVSSAKDRLAAHLNAIRARLGPMEELTHGGPREPVQGEK